ncbi:hypothetical protein [Streptomyces sp. NPDC004589]|uniref:hypothetical protein n=1 Tax=Streptomyces sp. NPDC004589 TaxID=3154553 RepID=UPI0033AB01FD
MSAFIQQLPALAGVVIGSLGSYLAVMLGDRTRFRREQTVRWEDRRLTAYSDYARSQKTIVSLLFRVSAHLGNDPHPHPLPPEEAATQLGSASETRDLAWEALLLLGNADVAGAAHEWARVVADMERFVRDQIGDPDGWSALLENQRVAREKYYATARRDASLPPGHSGRFQFSHN